MLKIPPIANLPDVTCNLLPFGLLKEYNALGNGMFLEGYIIWFNIPFSALVAWAFHILDTIGESSVNPFEDGANDISVTQTVGAMFLYFIQGRHLLTS